MLSSSRVMVKQHMPGFLYPVSAAVAYEVKWAFYGPEVWWTIVSGNNSRVSRIYSGLF